MRIFKVLFFFALASISNLSTATSNWDGFWRFDKQIEYDGDTSYIKPPTNPRIQLTDNSLIISNSCTVTLKQQEFFHSDPFQMLMKSGESKEKINSFFQKNFSFDLSKLKSYITTNSNTCNKLGTDLFPIGNQLVFFNAGSFFVYRKDDTAKTVVDGVNLFNHRTSKLPFNHDDFIVKCSGNIVGKNGVLKTTSKCAPNYFPYVVTKASIDPLSILIGSHNYAKNSNIKVSDYNNPVKNNLHPTFLLFPPMNDILLAVVMDFEQGDNHGRIGMTATYLSIKAGKVIDQIDGGCNVDASYTCVDNDGKKIFQLMPTGKLK